jgi:hypothetical protein
MKKQLKKILFVSLLGVILLTQQASAISLLDANDSFMGECLTEGDCNLCHFVGMFIQASDVLVYLSGVMAVAMIIYGGVVLITSYGNESRVTWGKNTIAATIVGIFIVMTAWTVINTLLFSLYGGNDNGFTKVVSATFDGDPKIGSWGGLCSSVKEK